MGRYYSQKKIPRKLEEAPDQVKMICIDLILRRQAEKKGEGNGEIEDERERYSGSNTMENSVYTHTHTNIRRSNIYLPGLCHYSVQNRPPIWDRTR